MDRYESVMEGAAIWGAFYRANPDKFAEDYLHIQLRLFQRILLAMMFWSTTFVLIACRGLGKTLIGVEPCYESASLAFSKQDFKQEFSKMMLELKDSLKDVIVSDETGNIHSHKMNFSQKAPKLPIETPENNKADQPYGGLFEEYGFSAKE